MFACNNINFQVLYLNLIYRVLSNIPSKSKSSAKKPKVLKESKNVEDISPALEENSLPSSHEPVDEEKEKMT